MIVDDFKPNREVLEGYLQSWGVTCHSVSSGAEALDALVQAEANETPYTLALVDYMMPEMDGYEATHMIREFENDNNNSHILIVAMAANAMEGDKEQCLNAGMDDYIAKPARCEDIKLTLEKYITK